ncbi:MAG: peptidoglycan-binding protein [Parvularcula sp.]
MGKKGDGFSTRFNHNTQEVIIQPSRRTRRPWMLIGFAAMICVLLLMAVFAVVFQAGKLNAVYERDLPELYRTRVDLENSTRLRENVVRDWTIYTRQVHVIDRKIGSLSLVNSLVGDPSDHILLGIFERDRTKRKMEAALHFYIAAANGHPDGYRLYKALNIPTEDYEELYQQFVQLHEVNGDLGLMRLGQYYLGADAFKIARRMKTRLRFDPPNDYIWPRQAQAEDLAYTNFQMASMCGLSSAYEWRAETARYYNFTVQRENALKQRANNQLRSLAQRYGVDQDAYCQRYHLNDALDLFKEYYMNRVVVQYESLLQGWDGRTNPCDLEIGNFSDEECDEFDAVVRSGDYGVASNIPTFRELLLLIEDTYNERGRGGDWRGRVYGDSRSRGRSGQIYGGSGAQPYRNAPGAQADWNVDTYADDGLPKDCLPDGVTGECPSRADALSCDDAAAYHFNRGVADMAVGRVNRARDKFNRAITVGRPCQSEYAELAAKRVAALNLTCEYTVDSLARISRGYANNPQGGAIIDLRTRQRALAAKGFYKGEIDGEYGPETRAAVRQYQRELGFSETGDLTPIETVYLVCSAAQVNADSKSTNTLGIMYVAGLGVVQNTDAGLRLLKQAAARGNTDAKFNLALIYGSGTVLSSYKLCGIVENLQIADAYLREASNAGHLPAQRLVRMFGQYSPTERWKRIRDDLLLNEFYLDRLEPVGEACRPNPGPLTP